MSKPIIKTNKNRKIRIRKNSNGWSVAMFFIGEVAAENVLYFTTRKDCLFEGEFWLEQA